MFKEMLVVLAGLSSACASKPSTPTSTPAQPSITGIENLATPPIGEPFDEQTGEPLEELDDDQKVLMREAIRSNSFHVTLCYNEALRKDPSLHGRVVLTFTVGTQGRVITARVEQTDVPDPSLLACIVDSTKDWRFPEPLGDESNVLVTKTFILTNEDVGDDG